MSVPTPTPSVNGTRRRRFCANRQYPWTVPGATDEADLRGATDEADLTTPVQAETSLPPPSPFMDRADRGATTNDAVAEEAALRCMMRMLLRSPELLAGVRTVLTTRDIERDSSYSLVWAVLFQTALDLTDQYGAPPSREVLTAEATLRIERAPELAGIPVAAALAEELEHVYSGEVTEADVAFGRNVVQLHLRRRTGPTGNFSSRPGSAATAANRSTTAVLTSSFIWLMGLPPPSLGVSDSAGSFYRALPPAW